MYSNNVIQYLNYNNIYFFLFCPVIYCNPTYFSFILSHISLSIKICYDLCLQFSNFWSVFKRRKSKFDIISWILTLSEHLKPPPPIPHSRFVLLSIYYSFLGYVYSCCFVFSLFSYFCKEIVSLFFLYEMNKCLISFASLQKSFC